MRTVLKGGKHYRRAELHSNMPNAVRDLDDSQSGWPARNGRMTSLGFRMSASAQRYRLLEEVFQAKRQEMSEAWQPSFRVWGRNKPQRQMTLWQ